MLLRGDIDEACARNVDRDIFVSRATKRVTVGIADSLNKATEERVG